jgi:hypothetical protein
MRNKNTIAVMIKVGTRNFSMAWLHMNVSIFLTHPVFKKKIGPGRGILRVSSDGGFEAG